MHKVNSIELIKIHKWVKKFVQFATPKETWSSYSYDEEGMNIIFDEMTEKKQKITIDDWGIINVVGDIFLRHPNLADGEHLVDNVLPSFIQFGNIDGDFDCSDFGLTTLRGCPKRVDGYFSAEENLLINLEYLPKKIKKGIDLSDNSLTSMEGLPRHIKGGLSLANNLIERIDEHCPVYIGGNFDIVCNPIKTIVHFPRKIKGELSISNKIYLDHKDYLEFNCKSAGVDRFDY